MQNVRLHKGRNGKIWNHKAPQNVVKRHPNVCHFTQITRIQNILKLLKAEMFINVWKRTNKTKNPKEKDQNHKLLLEISAEKDENSSRKLETTQIFSIALKSEV